LAGAASFCQRQPVQGHPLSLPYHLDGKGQVGLQALHQLGKLAGRRRHRLAVHRQQHVVGPQPDPLGRGTRQHFRHDQALVAGQVELVRQGGVQRLDDDAKACRPTIGGQAR